MTPDRPSVVPIDHEDVTARRTSAGPGEAITSSPRTTATMDAPVRVRALVPPSGRPT